MYCPNPTQAALALTSHGAGLCDPAINGRPGPGPAALPRPAYRRRNYSQSPYLPPGPCCRMPAGLLQPAPSTATTSCFYAPFH